MLTKALKNSIINLTVTAGEKILEIYNLDFEVYKKSNKSLQTDADLAAHEVIKSGLISLTPEVPMLSEESSSNEIRDRMTWDEYWLVDPLDGTKEFVNKNGEFTVNIAFIKDHKTRFGVVYAPALDILYYGGSEYGSFKRTSDGQVLDISVNQKNNLSKVKRIVGSRSHQSDEFKTFIQKYPDAEIVSMGSSLKFCMVAEGSADIYPRLGFTSEWDTAAAQAVVEGANGHVVNLNDQSQLRYNTSKNSLLNPHFLVS